MTTLIDSRYLSIVGESVTVDLATPAYYLVSIAPLLGSGDVRGRDRIIPGSPGVLVNPRRSTVTQHVLELHLNGDLDDDGVPTADPVAALDATVAFLIAQLVDSPGDVVAPERSATIQPSGRAAMVRVVEIEPREDQRGPALMVCSLVLEVPSGRFV